MYGGTTTRPSSTGCDVGRTRRRLGRVAITLAWLGFLGSGAGRLAGWSHPHESTTDTAAHPERRVEAAGVPETVMRACGWMVPALERNELPRGMLNIAWRESRCIPGVQNQDRSTGDSSYGIFQINTLGTLWPEVRRRCGVERREDLLDAGTNITCAGALYAAYGSKPWDRGRYFSAQRP